MLVYCFFLFAHQCCCFGNIHIMLKYNNKFYIFQIVLQYKFIRKAGLILILNDFAVKLFFTCFFFSELINTSTVILVLHLHFLFILALCIVVVRSKWLKRRGFTIQIIEFTQFLIKQSNAQKMYSSITKVIDND